MKSLPWFQFSSFLDTIGAIKYANNIFSDSLQKILCQSELSATSNNLDILSLDKTATGNLSQGQLPGSSIQSIQNESQDSRLNMIPTVLYTRGECNTNTLSQEILKKLPVLPENTQSDLRRTAESSVMRVMKIFMFLLSNNHVKDHWEKPTEMDSTILRIVRARNGLQYKQLLSHSGPTSEALSEKIFLIALRAQDVEACRILLDCGIDPNKQGFMNTYKTFTPLQFASCKGNVTIARMLIDAGADVNGNLAMSNSLEITNLLLSKGAQANTADGAFALHWAMKQGNVALAQTLISAGVDTACVDESGHTALHLAWKFPEMVKILLQADADVGAISYAKLTVLDHFVMCRSTDTIQLLLDASLEDYREYLL